MKNIINKISEKPRLLLHCCCAPCSTTVLSRLKDFFSITIFYYNPNIMPENEWVKRKLEFEKLKKICDFDLVVVPYNNNDYVKIIAGYEHEPERGNRCKLCIHHRLQETFIYAAKNQFDYFCSTLSVSPHKNSKQINEIGFSLETPTTKWLPNDFKKENGFLLSIELCKELDIYRQNYCGCIL